MSFVDKPAIGAGGALHCAILKDILGSVAAFSVACLDQQGAALWIASADSGLRPGGPVSVAPAGKLTSVTMYDLGPADVLAFVDLCGADLAARRTGRWLSLLCVFDNGVQDRLVVYTENRPETVQALVERTWQGLRKACIAHLPDTAADLSDDAMLWMVSQKVNAAILVIDEELRLLKFNAAGRDMLGEARLLSARSGALTLGSDRETRALRAAVADLLANRGKRNEEFILILRGLSRDAHVPMSLSVYPDGRTGQNLFLVMVPMPPDQKRIEGIALKMGLICVATTEPDLGKTCGAASKHL